MIRLFRAVVVLQIGINGMRRAAEPFRQTTEVRSFVMPHAVVCLGAATEVSDEETIYFHESRRTDQLSR